MTKTKRILKGKKIFIGSDHRGFELKTTLTNVLRQRGYDVIDVGCQDAEACDYPRFSQEVALGVARHRGSRGILVCMSGIGHAIAANKIPGVRAALCYNAEAARLSREHNDANVLVLGARFVAEKEMWPLIQIWLETTFEGGRHQRRVNQIKLMEKKFMKKL